MVAKLLKKGNGPQKIWKGKYLTQRSEDEDGDEDEEEEKESPLVLASQAKGCEVMKLLLPFYEGKEWKKQRTDAFVELAGCNSRSWVPEMMQRLFDMGVNLNQGPSPALANAAGHGKMKNVQFLLGLPGIDIIGLMTQWVVYLPWFML